MSARTPKQQSGTGPARDLTKIFDDNEVRDTYRTSFLANSILLPVYNSIKGDYNLTRGEYLLIFCLAHFPELTAQDVANMTGRPRNSISRGVHRMLSEGYLSRSPDETDGRQVLLTITDKGRKLHKELVERFIERDKAAFSALTPAEHNTFDRLLQKLVIHVANKKN